MAVVFDIDGKPPLGLPLVFCDIIHQNFAFIDTSPFCALGPVPLQDLLHGTAERLQPLWSSFVNRPSLGLSISRTP